MAKAYLTVVSIEDKHYVTLSDTGSEYRLAAHKTKDEALSRFDNFREKANSDLYESHISASVGILNLRPHIIALDANNPESLKPYLVNMTPILLRGSVFGAFVDFVGIEVTEGVLEFSVCDVASDIIR